ncbi:MAG TPA: YigZ family protein [Rudaea sp.]
MRYTLSAPARAVLDVRKSRFAAIAAPVASPEAAMAFVADVSDPDATHNVWAWRVGQQYRFNDDGEPSGTAGKPVLQAIDGFSLDGVAVVVARWFGGIKLGAGGLVRAYGGCAAECLRTAEKRAIVAMVELEFELPFAALPLLHARLPAFAASKLGESFVDGGARLRIQVPAAQVHALRALVQDLSRGRAKIRPGS